MDTFFLPEKQQLAIRGKPLIAASQQVPRARRLVLALLTSLVACAPLAAQAVPGMQAEAWVTTNDRRLELAHDVLPQASAQAAAHDAQTIINIEANQRYQRMVGFGAALTGFIA